MSSESNDWVVEARCPHGYKVGIPFDTLGYLLKPNDEQCKAHPPTLPKPPEPSLGMSERQIRREARRAAKNAAKKGWVPPWLSS